MSAISTVSSTPQVQLDTPIKRAALENSPSEETQESAIEKAREQKGPENKTAALDPTEKGIGQVINLMA